MSLDPHLPKARLRPKDSADRRAILRGQAADGARKVGRVAWSGTKAFALIALCGAGIVVIGAGTRSRSSADLDRRLESIKRMNESMRSIRAMPKIDYAKLLGFQPRALRNLDLSAPYLDPDLSPSQRRATSSP